MSEAAIEMVVSPLPSDQAAQMEADQIDKAGVLNPRSRPKPHAIIANLVSVANSADRIANKVAFDTGQGKHPDSGNKTALAYKDRPWERERVVVLATQSASLRLSGC